METFFRLIKFRYWSKNSVIFAPLVFSLHLFDPADLLNTLLSFLAFSCCSTFAYIVNDIRDREIDARHPENYKRPVASGKVGIKTALALGLLFLAAGLGLALYLGLKITIFILIYLVINLLYTFILKYFAIVDVFTISLSFCMRVLVGAAAIGVSLSHWMLLATFSVSLVLGFGKRRYELLNLSPEARPSAKNRGSYSDEILDIMTIISTALSAISYALYTMDEKVVAAFKTSNLIFTVPFVIFGLFRYLLLVYKKNKGGTPEKLVTTDPGIIISVILWFGSTVLILYSAKAAALPLIN